MGERAARGLITMPRSTRCAPARSAHWPAGLLTSPNRWPGAGRGDSRRVSRGRGGFLGSAHTLLCQNLSGGSPRPGRTGSCATGTMLWGAGSSVAWFSAGSGSVNVSSVDPAEEPTGPATLLPSPRAWDVVLCISGTLVSCENALVVAIIVGTPAFRAPMFLLVGSLAVADLLAGLGLVLHFAADFCIGSPEMSLVLVGVLAMAFTASIGSLLAITIDRYLSLYNALTYYSETTVNRTYVMLALVWVAALGLGLVPVLAWNCRDGLTTCGVVYPLSKNHLVVLAIAFFMVFGIMLQLYAQICRIVCRHAQQIALQRHLLPASHYVATRKGIATLAVVLGAFAACWLPFTVYCLLGDADSPPLYTYLTLLPATYNSMINPVIYAFRNQDVQKVLWAICCCCSTSKIPFRSRSPSDV